MSKYKFLLSFILFFSFGCAPVHDKTISTSKEKSDNNLIMNMEESNESENDSAEIKEDDNNDSNKLSDNENKEYEEKIENHKKQDDLNSTANKDSSSIGNNNSSNKKEEDNEMPKSNDEVETKKEIEETFEEKPKDDDKSENTNQPSVKEETKICEDHKWDDLYGNTPQFSELIFNNWSECDRVMNDIYNNFVTEEKSEYNKYYQNSKGQWMSSILASDVWCECGAHAYAIFITYE